MQEAEAAQEANHIEIAIRKRKLGNKASYEKIVEEIISGIDKAGTEVGIDVIYKIINTVLT